MRISFLFFIFHYLLFHSLAIANNAPDILFVSPVEVKSGRLIATNNCLPCHGLDGIGKMNNVPHLAGQHTDYLYAQLRQFQAGKRQTEENDHKLTALNQEALKHAAIYYSTQDLPMGPVGKKTRTRKTIDPLKAGETAAIPCAKCHGKTGNGTFSGMPRLTGKHQSYLASAIRAYQTGIREDAMMKKAVTSLSELAVENLSLFYASQKPIGSNIGLLGDASAGEELATTCAGCHGERGHSTTIDVPSLAGQDPAYLMKAINSYKKGLRKHEKMRTIAEGLANDEIRDIATFFANQIPKAPTITLPRTVDVIAEMCDRCHGINGNSTDRFIPSLSAQRKNYLILSMQSFKKNRRKNKMMQAMLQPVRNVDIIELANYYAAKHRRSVIFVAP